ncbi:hypothetical protein [Blastomonas sp. UPD001]|uniref:hypothetical protein n=1 Tax=Blastomonas sp. UPD001 TaxID=2217673 RepID=UPI0013008B36|nr:hypothetical protein [Blastomonas sp. UPD001]
MIVVGIKISRLKRLFALLCLALALVYAGSSASQLANTIQHSGIQSSAHEHSVLSEVLPIEVGHHADNDLADASDDQERRDIAGGHHHHGDTGPSLLATSAVELLGVMLLENLRAPAGNRHVDGIAVAGPERPPMVLRLAA